MHREEEEVDDSIHCWFWYVDKVCLQILLTFGLPQKLSFDSSFHFKSFDIYLNFKISSKYLLVLNYFLNYFFYVLSIFLDNYWHILLLPAAQWLAVTATRHAGAMAPRPGHEPARGRGSLISRPHPWPSTSRHADLASAKTRDNDHKNKSSWDTAINPTQQSLQTAFFTNNILKWWIHIQHWNDA